VDPARPRVGRPIRNGCRSVTDCHKRREVYKGAPSLLRVPASEHAASSSSAPWFPRNTRKLKAERRDSIRSMGFRERPRAGRPMATYCPACSQARRTLWMTGTHHIIFSLGLALHRLGTASVMSNLGRSLYGEASTIHRGFIARS
jgi:hypothetical protein